MDICFRTVVFRPQCVQSPGGHVEQMVEPHSCESLDGGNENLHFLPFSGDTAGLGTTL